MKPILIKNKILQSITYILPTGKDKDCWLVDCGDVEEAINKGWNILGVLLTHAHSDHIYGLNTLMQTSPKALVYTNEAGKEGLMNPKINFSKYHDDIEDFIFSTPENIRIIDTEGMLKIDDSFTIEAIFTPGHEPSCISYRIDNCLFTGDSYIPDMKTVTSFPRSNRKDAAASLSKLQKMQSEGAQVMSGHWF